MKGTIFIVALFITQSAFSGGWVTADVESLKSFTEQDNNYIHVSGFSNPDNCPINTTLVIIRDDTNNWKMVHSNTLAGFLAGKNMQFRVSGCRGSYAIVDGVEILK